MSIKGMFARFDDECRPVGSVTFNWSAKGIGFGQMEFHMDEDGYVHCYNEIMSRKFLKEMLCAMVDNCVLDESNDTHEDNSPDGKPPGYPNKPIQK